MNIVIPMAGAGSRFTQAGYTLPKPLIEVAGQPMYRWAVDSLPIQPNDRVVFILREDEFLPQLQADIESHYEAYQPIIHVLKTLSRGQAETVWLARTHYALDQPILIHNADTAFALTRDAIALPDETFGMLVVFDDDAPRWSFARTDASGLVVEVREKQVISRHASTGTYYFAQTDWLLDAIEDDLAHDRREQGEFYLAPLYNRAIANGKRVVIAPCEQFTCMGTPTDLAQALPHMGELAQAQQHQQAKSV